MLKIEGWLNAHWRLFSAVLLILAAGWIWLSRASTQAMASAGSAPQVGFPAPGFTLNTLDGKKVSLIDYKGKVVLVNFWASWCPPCQAEMQAIQSTFRDDQARGLVVLAVNTTYQDDPTAAAAFARSQGLTFLLLSDRDGSVTHSYQVGALPTSFFIDAAGKIQDVVVGGPMAEALIRSRVDRLLQGGP
jgi:cytochrome c biogenesis protein CcmG/thiol:disulfide interchange protein DsbE